MVDQQDRGDWHRYFAVECNNRAWELATAERSAAEDDELLNVAHASAYHWSIAGDELNRMRALMLLAEVHACLAMGTTALTYAERMRSYFLGLEAVDDWELAFVHVIHAHAAASAGKRTEHAESYAAAEAALEAIADEQDRAVVLETFELVPAP